MKKIVFSNNFYVCLGYVFGFEMKIGEFGDVLLIYCLPVYCNRKRRGFSVRKPWNTDFQTVSERKTETNCKQNAWLLFHCAKTTVLLGLQPFGAGSVPKLNGADSEADRRVVRGSIRVFVLPSGGPSPDAGPETRNGAILPDSTASSKIELLTRLELVTSSLPRKCSTTELQQQFSVRVVQKYIRKMK